MSTGSNSPSESSSGSQNQPLMLRDTNNDFTLIGSSATILSRTGTVRRASGGAAKRVSTNGESQDDSAAVRSGRSSPEVTDRYRKSLDSTYRLSLESISEYKTKTSFSSASLYPSRDCSSMESSSSDYTDNAVRSLTQDAVEKTLMSPASSYLSWIESVNSEYFVSSGTTTTDNNIQEIDNKVGEWNNFWLNYNSARSRYLSSPYLSTYNDDRTGDDVSDVKSTCSTQREFTDKTSLEQVILSLDEINEAIRCSQRITEILERALKRNEHDLDDSKNDSYYSTQQQQFSQHSSVKEDSAPIVQRERSFSYAIGSQDLQKQKQLLKPAHQSSSSSCINALLSTTGVADILKRVMAKRRDITTSPPDDAPTLTRNSFSDWTTSK